MLYEQQEDSTFLIQKYIYYYLVYYYIHLDLEVEDK